MRKLDVVIIGAGTAGLSARREVAKKPIVILSSMMVHLVLHVPE